MDIRAFLSHIVQLDIRIRKAINTQMHGNFSSVFKGSGLEFSDLRQYQYGDDIRHIDWNSTAKGHGTFIKLFKEEKEQTVFSYWMSAPLKTLVKGRIKTENT